MWLMMSEVSVKSISEDLRSVFSKGTIERARRTRTNIENYYRWDSFSSFHLFLYKTGFCQKPEQPTAGEKRETAETEGQPERQGSD